MDRMEGLTMPIWSVPAIIRVNGFMLVEASSEHEALDKVESQDYIDIEIATPFDVEEAEANASFFGEDIEKVSDD